MRFALCAWTLAAALGLTACGGDDAKSGDGEKAQGARDPAVQKEVGRSVRKETEKRIEQQTGAYVDPELGGPSKADCIPESDSKLSCIVEGTAQAGFGETADPNAQGPFQFDWDVTVDPATGKFQARPASMQLPGQL